ncbi:MAG TPA: hypothetical protein VGF94_17680 [Kofleriaceae bacterium]|jgi:hypothetical protein
MRKLVLVVVIAGLGFGAWKWHARATARATHGEAKLVQNRLWIDHVPKNDRDTFQVFATLSDEGIGIFQATSAWKGGYEAFQYEANGDELRAVYPQTGDKEKLHATARRCNDGGMDYCLELSGSSRGVQKYYSLEGWELDSLADEQAQVRALEH